MWFNSINFRDMETGKYIEKVKIFRHYTNYKGRLFVKALCDLFNDVAQTQTEQEGVDVETLNAAGATWMLRRLHIRLHKMPALNEEVFIETWPSGIDRLFALRDFRMVRENGEELVRATSEWMYIDLARRRPLRQPEKVVRMSTGHAIPRVDLEPILDEKGFVMTAEGGRYFEATFDNIDFNGHVTQSAYVQWMMDAHGFLFQERAELKEFEVIYVHELKPGGEVRVEVLRQDSGQGQAAAGAVAAAESRQGIAAVEEEAEEEAEEALLESAEGGETVLSYRVSSLDGSVVHAYGRGVWKKRLC